jgi:hypothetical protein
VAWLPGLFWLAAGLLQLLSASLAAGLLQLPFASLAAALQL